TGHSFVLVPAVPAGCETDGHTAYYVCERCGKLVRDAAGTEAITLADTVIPATGHDWGEWVVLKEATADEDGLKERICRHNTEHRQSERIPARKAVSYPFVSGDGSTFVKGENATFIVKREVNDDTTFSRFLGIKIDGQTVASDDYTAKQGSVIITLHPAYVKTLSVGDHTITVLFNDGSTTGSFTIVDTAPTSATTTPTSATTTPTSATTAPTSVDRSDSPQTGDDTNTGLWLIMTIGSLAAAMTIVLLRRKKYA
ncbi:MAG: LPXTG cell wall anchor domain-containing protein, partial [Clostridia bacterium]|nr:LPXTG cell wall anchor domain-containing protein [Clostridia bacterium]